MTLSRMPINRRHFIAAAGMSALAARAFPISSRIHIRPGFAFAAATGELSVYSTHEGKWTLIQTVPSEAPISLAVDSSTHTLHVLHSVAEHRGLPCSYIESFRIDRGNGQLAPLSIQPLSLSAVHPRHMALAVDGKMLAVAVHGGAAYNLLPILQDGRPGRPCAIRKETGLNSASPSRPGYVAFTSGADRIFALDQGAATLSVFSTQPEMPVLSRLSLGESSIPLSLASYMQGNLLFVVDRESGSLLTVRHDPANASLSRQSDVIQGDFLGPAAVHAASKTLFLVAADSIYNYRIQAETGELTLLQRLRNTQPYGQTQHLLCDDEDHVLYLPTSQGVAGSNIDPECGHISPLKRVAPSAHTIALL